MTATQNNLLLSLEEQLLTEIRTNIRLMSELAKSDARINELKADLLKGYLATVTISG